MKQMVSRNRIEAEELGGFSARTDYNVLVQRALNAEKRAQAAEERAERERERRERESLQMLSGVCVIACIVSAMACLISDLWFTAVAPLMLCFMFAKKGGWL